MPKRRWLAVCFLFLFLRTLFDLLTDAFSLDMARRTAGLREGVQVRRDFDSKEPQVGVCTVIVGVWALRAGLSFFCSRKLTSYYSIHATKVLVHYEK